VQLLVELVFLSGHVILHVQHFLFQDRLLFLYPCQHVLIDLFAGLGFTDAVLSLLELVLQLIVRVLELMALISAAAVRVVGGAYSFTNVPQ